MPAMMPASPLIRTSVGIHFYMDSESCLNSKITFVTKSFLKFQVLLIVMDDLIPTFQPLACVVFFVLNWFRFWQARSSEEACVWTTMTSWSLPTRRRVWTQRPTTGTPISESSEPAHTEGTAWEWRGSSAGYLTDTTSGKSASTQGSPAVANHRKSQIDAPPWKPTLLWSDCIFSVFVTYCNVMVKCSSDIMAYRHLKQKEFVAGICSWNYRYYKIAQFLKKLHKHFSSQLM